MANIDTYQAFLNPASTATFDSLPKPVGNLEEFLYKLCEFKQNAFLVPDHYTEMAKDSAAAALLSEGNAKISETNAKDSEVNAKESELNAKESEERAGISEENALRYADSAMNSAELLLDAVESCTTAESNAKESEANAKSSEDNAKASEDNAKQSEEITAASEAVVVATKEYLDSIMELILEESHEHGIYPSAKGDYLPTEQYNPLDIVKFGFATYIAKEANIGKAPDENPDIWMTLIVTNDVDENDIVNAFEYVFGGEDA